MSANNEQRLKFLQQLEDCHVAVQLWPKDMSGQQRHEEELLLGPSDDALLHLIFQGLAGGRRMQTQFSQFKVITISEGIESPSTYQVSVDLINVFCKLQAIGA